MKNNHLFKLLLITGLSVLVMFFLPLLVVTFVHSDAGMAMCFILFFVVNPIFSIFTGITIGKYPGKLIFTAAIPPAIFLISSWILFSAKEPLFILYSGAYLLFTILSALATYALILNKTQK